MSKSWNEDDHDSQHHGKSRKARIEEARRKPSKRQLLRSYEQYEDDISDPNELLPWTTRSLTE